MVPSISLDGGLALLGTDQSPYITVAVFRSVTALQLSVALG